MGMLQTGVPPRPVGISEARWSAKAGGRAGTFPRGGEAGSGSELLFGHLPGSLLGKTISPRHRLTVIGLHRGGGGLERPQSIHFHVDGGKTTSFIEMVGGLPGEITYVMLSWKYLKTLLA